METGKGGLINILMSDFTVYGVKYYGDIFHDILKHSTTVYETKCSNVRSFKG